MNESILSLFYRKTASKYFVNIQNNSRLSTYFYLNLILFIQYIICLQSSNYTTDLL